MSLETDRNPSPPPELLHGSSDLLPDRIGDSVFSKHWLFQILINIVEVVNKEAANDACTSESNENKERTDVIELDPKLEDDICALWDMSANSDVAHFLHEFKVSEIFIDVIEKTKSPRLLEVTVGILGNIASFENICQDISSNTSFVNSIIGLTGSSDSPTVVQVLRLIHTGVVNRKAASCWLEILKESSLFNENIKFILVNSLNGDVLKGSLQLLYYVLETGDDICLEWAKADFTQAVIDAGKQLLALADFESIDELWLILNLLCQQKENIDALAEHFGALNSIFYAYVMKFGDYEDDLPPAHRVAAVAASFTTFGTLLSCENVNHSICNKGDVLLINLKKMFVAVDEVLLKGTFIEKNLTEDIVAASHEVEKLSVIESVTSHCQENIIDESQGSCTGADIELRNKFTESSLNEDDYSRLFILKESLAELSSLIVPLLVQE